ncbi:hypothetical protein FH966_00605 [Lentibacillus cibarius]|uniref:Uncharacterized protein n=1 Tax=Lentibacillus cibarius TaxID=2583219 RepID=A0A549YER2_9BACI|nr:hypothetical protein [Lentibacillus cibarius]TRM10337.1 hypothetical protein FH966_00605 [Lentibacillus cibarius]
MKLLNTNGQIQKAKFACKVDSVDEIKNHWSQSENQNEDYKVVELAIMNEDEFEDFKNNLLADWDFLNGKGGIDSTTVPETIEGKSFFEWTEEEREEFRRGAYRECVGVTTAEANEMIVVDPQGHNYGRYTAIV